VQRLAQKKDKSMSSQKDHWEDIYKTRDHKQVGWYQESPKISLELFSKINAEPSQSVIDVGCGASVLVDNLINQGYRDITLLDLSEEALSAIKRRLGDNAGIPEYLCQDITKTKFNKSFDVWHDRAVFHFLTGAADRKKYVSVLAQSLSNTGHAIIGTFSLKGPNMCSGLDVVQYDKEKLALELGNNLELINSIDSTHVMPGGAKQEYTYFIIRHKKV
jgi:arsenite methyltransferase